MFQKVRQWLKVHRMRLRPTKRGSSLQGQDGVKIISPYKPGDINQQCLATTRVVLFDVSVTKALPSK
jgi:hypothetical protein